MPVWIKEVFSTRLAQLQRSCKMLLSSYRSCAGGHGGSGFGEWGAVSVCMKEVSVGRKKHVEFTNL